MRSNPDLSDKTLRFLKVIKLSSLAWSADSPFVYDGILSSLTEIPSGMLEAARGRYKRSIKLLRQLHFAIVQSACDYITQNDSEKKPAGGFRSEAINTQNYARKCKSSV